MFEVAGISMVLVSLIATMALVIATALHARRLAAQAAALRSHPVLDPEWLGRKRAVLMSMAQNAQRMREALARLKTAYGEIARDLDELAIAGYTTAGAVEEILGTTAPWLRGLFAARRGEG